MPDDNETDDERLRRAIRESWDRHGGLPPGHSYQVSEPEVFGNFPVRTELTVLSADLPRPYIGWTVECRSGAEVFLLDQNDNPIEQPLTDKNSLRPGMRILAPTLVGHYRAVVALDGAGDLYWETEGTFGDLNFAEDDRLCWITTYAVNKKVLGAIMRDL